MLGGKVDLELVFALADGNLVTAQGIINTSSYPVILYAPTAIAVPLRSVPHGVNLQVYFKRGRGRLLLKEGRED